MERTSTFETGLIMMAFLMVAAAIGLVLLAPALDTPGIPVLAAKAQATEQEMAEAWENLLDAIRRDDQVEIQEIVEWLDEESNLEKTHVPEVIRNWCKYQHWDFCKEKDNETK